MDEDIRQDTDKLTDEELVARAVAGNEEMLAPLIQRYVDPIYAFLFRMVGNQQDAEDCSQEVFLKVWKNLHTFKLGMRFKTWLYAIARNAAIDMLRKKRDVAFSRFDTEEGGNVLVDSLTDPEPLPEELAQKAEDTRMLEQVLPKLKPQHKEVLLLHYREHMTFDEIGKVLGAPLDTVKSQHRRAIIELRNLLGP